MWRCDIFLIKGLTDVNQKSLGDEYMGHFKEEQENSGSGVKELFQGRTRRH